MNNIEVLKWYEDMGATEIVSDASVNRFEEKKNPEKQSTAPAAIREVTGPEHSKSSVRSIADTCNTLEALKDAVVNYKGLAITKTATNTVFSDGNPQSEIMMVGEAPGAEEDLQGIPFCGASGKMLDQMFSYVDIRREKNFYITNTIFWRPPGNRRPTPEELAICAPFVEKHISLIKPKLIILVGGTAVAALLDSKLGITKLRGKFFDYTNQYLDAPIKTTAIFHPSYLLRSPGQKKLAWQDILMLKQYIDENNITL